MERGAAIKRAAVISLGVLFIAVYLAAKVHFLTRYDDGAVAAYVCAHSGYWAALAGIAVIALWISRKSSR